MATNDTTSVLAGGADPSNGSTPPTPPTPAANGNGSGNAPAVDPVSQEALPSEILKRLQPELQALSVDELIQVNVDVPTAVSIVLGSLPEVRAHRDAIAKKMNDFDLATFDKLEDYAIAFNEAHGDYLAATQPGDDLDALLEEGVRLREVLLSDANALAVRGLVDGAKLLELKGPIGHKNLASDLNLLCKVFQATWAQIQGKSAVTAAELERANRLNLRIIRVVGLREQNRAAVAAATDIRVRAFTLMTRAYDNVRRAIHFLRWNEGDSDRIAPSLFSNRNTTRRKDTSGETPPNAPTTTPANPRDSHSTPPGIAPNAHPAGEASTLEHETPDAAAGTPGSQPFMNT